MKKAGICLMVLCFSFALSAKLTLSYILDKVAKEPNIKKFLQPAEDGSFSDSLISIAWNSGADGFRFDLTNKSNATLSISWEQVFFVNEKGEKNAIVHGEPGKKLEIAAGSQVSGVVAPVDLIQLGKKGWFLSPIFQEKWSDEEFETIRDKNLVIKVIFPIYKGKMKTLYHFQFKAIAR